MEPNKIEKQFREKLNSREIQPSEMAWDRLDAMLSVGEEKKEKRSFGWIYIAASVIGFMIITTVFLTQTQELTDVERNTVVTKENKDNKKLPELIPNTTSVVPEAKNPVAVEEKRSTIKKTVATINESSESSTITSQNQVSIINQKNEQFTNQSSVINENELLGAVENPDIKPISPAKSSSLKVDPNTLLSQVDGELELTFREKVIESISKKYKSVKVAVSSRNQQ